MRLAPATLPVFAHSGPHHGAQPAAGGELLLVLGLVAAGAVYVVGLRRLARHSNSLTGGARRLGLLRSAAFPAGILVVAATLLPPLDTAADTGFAWHMAQHMVLIAVAAPLLAAGSAGVVLGLALPRAWRPPVQRMRVRGRRAPGLRLLTLPLSAWLLHVAVLWLWHLPCPYDLALSSDFWHAAEHLCFLLTAWALWWHVFRLGRRRLPGPFAVLYVFATALPSGALGALLTFASHPLYSLEAGRSMAAGRDPLRDQQIAGLVMWLPADFLYLGVSAAVFLTWLNGEMRRSEAAPVLPPRPREVIR